MSQVIFDRDQLQHVYWIGGGSRAGKSTVARRVAFECGCQLYETDAAMAEHAHRSTPTLHPFLARFLAMDMDERWVNRSPRTMLETFPWFLGECFEMILEDLLALPSDRPIIAEGFRLLPRSLLPYLTPGHAIWLLPTPRFRQHIVETTANDAWAFLKKTSDPEKARNNLLLRDLMFTEHLASETEALGLPSIEIDVGTSHEEVAERVMRALAFLK